MGLERLFFRGVLQCYSKQCPLFNMRQKSGVCLGLNGVNSVCVSTCTKPTTQGTFGFGIVTRFFRVAAEEVAGLRCKIFGQWQRRWRWSVSVLVPRRSCSSSSSSSSSSMHQPSRDVTLFEHDRTHFFRLLSAFCGGQFVFWTYLGHFAYTGLRNTKSGTSEKDKSTSEVATTTTTTTTTTYSAGFWSFDVNLGSSGWRYGFTLGCLGVGAGILGLGVLFCRRSVSRVVLHQGGKMVSVSTQSPFGADRGRKITVPLSQVACHAHRQESTAFVPLRVKGHKFYFLLDKEGTLNNVRLFDITVGAYRPL